MADAEPATYTPQSIHDEPNEADTNDVAGAGDDVDDDVEPKSDSGQVDAEPTHTNEAGKDTDTDTQEQQDAKQVEHDDTNELKDVETADTTNDADNNDDDEQDKKIQIVITKEENDDEKDINALTAVANANTDDDIDVDDEKRNRDLKLDLLGDLGDMGQIDRAHSDPFGNPLQSEYKRASIVKQQQQLPPTAAAVMELEVAPKKHHSAADIHDRKFKTGDIRAISTEYIKIYRQESGHEKKEEIVVPSRDIVTKMPFHSTPLTRSATNNAFYDFKERLVEMGFTEQAEAALVHTQCESVENAVSFILNNFDAIYHRFGVVGSAVGLVNAATVTASQAMNGGDGNNGNRSSRSYEKDAVIATTVTTDEVEAINGGGDGDGDERLCTFCGQIYEAHLIDEHGEKIGIGVYGDNFNHDDEDVELELAIAAAAVEDIDNVDSDVRLSSPALASVPAASQMFPAQPVEEAKTNVAIAASAASDDIPPDYDGPTEQCLICFDEKPVDYFRKTECGHDLYCKQCLTQHYKHKTTDGDVLKVKCIDPDCDREIKEDEILEFLVDDEVRAKFKKFKRQKLLMLNENARFCPTADCEGYMIGSRMKKKLDCPICAVTICFDCGKHWHGYFTKCSSAVHAGGDNEMDQKFFQW
eukprot:CAMPEP_0202732858 /NCGR_PEP_ID=MMETSP1385-20130828/187870_1 /ASSEMBLY_ACC=CAM_ASM_000861 /TAXON_ID=933848 /ORGANISM="Elphidium margaritaceum" /LENGTH=642 /DNA_ID=CAMNT_0049399181 /DNA_START=55 /DNA_END=1980 /DNA_ORIENTATION=+